MSSDLTDRLKAEAARLGFDHVGVAPAVAPRDYPHFLEWLRAGRAVGLPYLERGAEARAHPRSILEGVRSVVVVSLVYGNAQDPPLESGQGKIARYARGADYHEVLWRRLESLLGWLEREAPGIRGRAVADTAPLLERDFARLAGLGWIGKNTMLINRRIGSFTVLGALLVDSELEYDRPHDANHCGSCTRCLDACPTDAFAGPYQLDPTRCLSYWTIEHRGTIPDEIAANLNGWAFGCDICQEVCPWNRKAAGVREPDVQPRPEWTNPDLVAWLEREPREFAKAIKPTALARAKRTGLVRNAALVLGAQGDPSAVPALTARLGDPDPVIRASAIRALGWIGTADALAAIVAHENEPDPLVRETLQRVRSEMSG